MEQPRHIIIHGHFYQPPRESPWTGLIAPEPGAAPFANWNERILSECYNANAHAHMMDGRVVRIRNNYESINFNFGPTLIGWLERHGKAAYRAIRLGDEVSAKHRGGYGNAMAQAYNHSIMPLLSNARQGNSGRVGYRGFRLSLRPAAPRACGCPNARLTTSRWRRWRARESSTRSWRRGRDALSGDDASASEAGPFEWRQGDLSIAVFRFERDLSGADRV